MVVSPIPNDTEDPIRRGARFRAARLARGIGQAELGRRVGATQSLIGQIECGRILRSKYETLIMFELGIPLDPETERWILASRQSGAGAVAGAQGAQDPAPGDAAEQDAAAQPANAHAPAAPVPIRPSPADASAAALRRRLATDYQFFAAERLRIRSKGGAIEPLVFNRAQRHIHAELEAQRAATGKVRALILKGRQQGCSTYVGGRYYHRASHGRGLKVFILSHEEQATKNLFEMVERFHDNWPERPATGVANASELHFDALDSGYKVGTAGTRGVGRSATLQLLHGSEVAFWPHAQTHVAGVLQAVPDEAGTEVILELTANGVGNLFHKMWRDAEAGLSGYIAMFVPWYWQDEYRRPLAGGPRSGPGMLTAEEHDYAVRYGLDDEQMAWRRMKIAELGDADLFAQEYPATAAEAFRMSGHDSFIPPALIARARTASCEPSGPLVIGYDPAWLGGDRHAMAWRRGRRLLKVESRSRLDTVAAAGWARWVIDQDKPAQVLHRRGRRRRRRLRPAQAPGRALCDHRGGGEFRRLAARSAAARRAGPAVRRAAQPPRRAVAEIAAMARGRRRRADPGFRCAAGRRLRPGLPLRRPHPARAREQGGHAPARRAEPGRMGRGRPHLRQAGGAAGGAELVLAQDRVSEDRADTAAERSRMSEVKSGITFENCQSIIHACCCAQAGRRIAQRPLFFQQRRESGHRGRSESGQNPTFGVPRRARASAFRIAGLVRPA